VERQRTLGDFNRTAGLCLREVLLHELFEQRAEQQPEAVALEFSGGALSYAELNARDNRLAHHLIEAGAGAGVRLALCLQRGPALVLAQLATLKAGATWVPVDPAWPPARIEALLLDAAPLLVLAEAATASRCHSWTLLDIGDDKQWAHGPCANPPMRARPSDLAWVIYTSGSSGAPKGVMAEHRHA